jgi:hypothetical protein
MLDEGNKFAARLSPKLEQEVARRFAEHQQQEKERVATFGEIRPQISLELKGRRFVVVGGTLHHSDKWKFFPDFLNDFVPAIFGKEWGQTELAKPENERHPIVQWRGGASRYINAQQPEPDGIYRIVPNGFTSAYMYFGMTCTWWLIMVALTICF